MIIELSHRYVIQMLHIVHMRPFAKHDNVYI